MISICYLSIAQVYPSYCNLELNIGENIIIKLISEVFIMSTTKAKKEYQKLGDFGNLVYKFKKQKRVFEIEKKNFTVNEILENLKEVCNISGKDSNEKRLRILKKLIREMDEVERKYFVRIIETKLKIGLALQNFID